MSDEPFRFAISPVVTERNARRLIDIMAALPSSGITCEDLRREFEAVTGLKRQSFYGTLAYCKYKQWVIGGGGPRNPHQLYSLNPDASWRPSVSTGEPTGEPLTRDQLKHLADLRARQVETLQDEVGRLRDWGSGSDANETGVAIPSLIRIITDTASTVRQRLKAAETILNYRVSDSGVVEFTKKFLQAICTSADVATDHRVEAAGLLRRCESPRIAPETVKPSYSNDGTEAQRTEAWRTYERWQLKKQIVLETRDPPKPGWDEHLKASTYQPPEGNSWPPVRVVTDPTSGFRLLDNLMPSSAGTRRNGSGELG